MTEAQLGVAAGAGAGVGVGAGARAEAGVEARKGIEGIHFPKKNSIFLLGFCCL